jgi:peptide/nickel transport system ATP-binding protein
VTGQGPCVLETRDVTMDYTIRRGERRGNVLRAVDSVSLCIEEGKTLGLVGESGSGKSTLGRVAAGLLQPTSGRVLIDGVDPSQMTSSERRAARSAVQVVFQDPFSSLDPKMSIEDILLEPLRAQRRPMSKGASNTAADLLDQVGLPRSVLKRSPRALSGGQRQRIGIARAVALRPRLIVLDEPVSALDVSVQAQILNLLSDLQNATKVSFLFISHDLSVVKHVADQVAVMYLGRLVERADAETFFLHPQHPYSEALISAVPSTTRTAAEKSVRIVLRGEIPSPSERRAGCPFESRCWLSFGRCREEDPALLPQVDGSHEVACHLRHPSSWLNGFVPAVDRDGGGVYDGA